MDTKLGNPVEQERKPWWKGSSPSSNVFRSIAFMLLVLFIGLSIVAVIMNKAARHGIDEGQANDVHINSKRMIRSLIQKRDTSDSPRSITIYIRESCESGYEFQSLDVPIVQYNRSEFVLSSQWILFPSRVVLYVHRRKQQTLILNSTKVFILPAIVNKNRKLFSLARLFSEKYASLYKDGTPLTKKMNLEDFIDDSTFDRISFNRRTKLFPAPLKLHKTWSFDKSCGNQYDNEDSSDEYSGDSAYRPEAQRRFQTRSPPCVPACNFSQVCVNKVCVGKGSFGITLTWSVSGDGDLVVTTPNNKTIIYYNQGPDSNTEFGQLDRDDRIGTGPENIFWSTSVTPPAGTYHICFQQYALNATIANPITATVQVRELFAPTRIISTTFTSRSDPLPDYCRPDLDTFITSANYP